MDARRRAASDAIARARDLLAPEDELLSARLDDVERGASTGEIDAVLALVAGALASANRPRPLDYRKLVALQGAARARRVELDAGPPLAAGSTRADPVDSPSASAPATVASDVERPGGLIGWLGRLTARRPR